MKNLQDIQDFNDNLEVKTIESVDGDLEII